MVKTMTNGFFPGKAAVAGSVRLAIDSSLSGKVRLAAILVRSVRIDDGASLWSVFEPLCQGLAARHTGQTISQVPGIEPARALYRSIGVDPTRVRPSSEALIRRVIKGKPLYRLGSLVDTINYCSLCTLMPMGLYDLDRIEGEGIFLRRGRAGEAFEGIRKAEVHLDGRYALFDSEGPFGSPTSDSLRTSIRSSTENCLVTIFAPFRQVDPETLHGHAVFTAQQIERFGGGNPQTEVLELIG